MSALRLFDSRLAHVPSADWGWQQVAAALSPRYRATAVAIAEATASEILGLDLVAFGSARTAIWAALRATPGLRRAWVPAYTCVAVPNAVEAAGLEIRWADVDGPNISMKEVLADAQPGDAVIAQHTYGIAPDPAGLRAARAAGMFVVEDRAHRFDADQLIGQAVVFSLEHSKVVSGGQGGLLGSSDPATLETFRAMQRGLRPMGSGTARRVLLTSLSQLALDWRGDVLSRVGSASRRLLLRVPLASIRGQTEDEVSGRGIQPAAMHPRLAGVAEHSIRCAAVNVAHRIAIGRIYHEQLSELVPEWLPAGAALVRFPVIVEDAATIARLMRQRGLDLGPRWFEAPVHPAGAISSYVPTSAPAAEHLAARVLTLPTHARVSTDEATRIAATVAEVTNLK